MNVQSVDTEQATEVRPDAGPSILPDPGAIWAIFWRRRLVFFLPALLIALLIVVHIARAVPLYAAQSTVIVEPRKADALATSGQPIVTSLQPENDAIDTEVQILSSPGLAGRVAQALQLQRYPEYAYRGPIGYDPAQPSMHPLAARLLANISVRRVGLSFVIGVTARSHDPVLAATIANEFARQYIQQQTDAKNDVNRQATMVLDRRLRDIRAQAVTADAELQRYKIANGLMSAEGSTMAEQEVSQLNDQIASARAEYAQKVGLLAAARNQIGRGGGGDDVPATLQSATISGLRGREAEASQKLADLRAHYGDLYPDVVRTKQELSDIRAQIKGETTRIISSLQADAAAAGSRLASLTSSQARAKGTLASNNSAQVGLLELQRKADATRAIYEAFLNRSKETMSRDGLSQADAHISTVSRVPTFPFSPNIPLLILFGVLGSLVGGVMAVAAAEYLERGIATKTDVERKLRVRFLGVVPELRSTLDNVRDVEWPQDYLLSHPSSVFAESFRSLRTILTLRGGSGPHVVAVTSALPREGKSTTAMCLARTYAGSDLKTVLVDCDVRRRSSSLVLLPPDTKDLIHYFEGVPIDAVLRRDPRSNLQVLGTTVPSDGALEYFSRANIARLLGELRERFDVIILDTAPVLALAETRDLAAGADAVLMAMRWRKTSRKAADTAIDMLLGAKARLRGVALTLVDVRKYAGSGEGDVYSYHKKFAGYYVN